MKPNASWQRFPFPLGLAVLLLISPSFVVQGRTWRTAPTLLSPACSRSWGIAKMTMVRGGGEGIDSLEAPATEIGATNDGKEKKSSMMRTNPEDVVSRGGGTTTTRRRPSHYHDSSGIIRPSSSLTSQSHDDSSKASTMEPTTTNRAQEIVIRENLSKPLKKHKLIAQKLKVCAHSYIYIYISLNR